MIWSPVVCLGDVEVAGLTADWEIRIPFPAFPYRVLALWWQGGKRQLWTSQCLSWGRLGLRKIPSCPWRWLPGRQSKFGNWTTVLSGSLSMLLGRDLQPVSLALVVRHLSVHDMVMQQFTFFKMMLIFQFCQPIQQLVLSSELCGVLPANPKHSFVDACAYPYG